MKAKPTTETLPAVILEPITVPPHKDFRNANNVTKARMLMEYSTLDPKAKQAWREEHNCTQALVSYHKRRLERKRRGSDIRPGTIEARDAITVEMLDAYLALPHIGGFKSAWLKEHGINHQQIHEVKKRVEKQRLQAKANGQILDRIQPAHSATSLDDAINYMKVKRDLYSEFIMDLERMRH